MRRKIFQILTIILLLTSCGIPKNTVILDIENPVILKYSKNEDYIIIEKVRINDTLNDWNLIFDTGSNGTVIDKSVAKKLNLKTIRKVRLVDITGKKTKVPFVKIDSINISGAIFKNIYALVSDLSLFECDDVKIILGNNVLKKGIWHIDLSTNKITLYNKKDDFDFSEYKVIPFSYRINLIKIQFELNKKKYRNVLFDTGNPTDCLILKKKDRSNFNSTPSSIIKILYRSINNSLPQIISRDYFILPNFKLNNNTSVDSVYVRFSRKRSMGLGLFKNNQIVIDYNKKLIGVKKNLSQMKSTTKNVGLAFNLFDDSNVVVSAIRLNSSADRMGIELGDTIEIINDLEIYKMNLARCELIDSLNHLVIDTMQLKLVGRNDTIILIP